MLLTQKKEKGFTLTELMASVAITSILISLSLTTISKQTKRAHLAEATTLIATGLKIAGIESQKPGYTPTNDCNVPAIDSKGLNDWIITCDFEGEIFTIKASGKGSNPNIPTTLSTGTWSLNRTNGSITQGVATGL
ncbi:prepilin-type N-terminal cleavage/methylation domain protein [Synechococcus sp. PROS-7-1]|uniref:type II secretion system protein n=1 Tax=Synechococcus sp. PROS-7-1 TaxID=1442556 RepID=UPI001649003C|nr:type II secretion system protein [Synechococcus sp. PROS-7-1]QNI85828.1 prepilin-type N-terminal cleavage/methylation domain protein [Synechococcus sp. PROS-7-1]